MGNSQKVRIVTYWELAGPAKKGLAAVWPEARQRLQALRALVAAVAVQPGVGARRAGLAHLPRLHC